MNGVHVHEGALRYQARGGQKWVSRADVSGVRSSPLVKKRWGLDGLSDVRYIGAWTSKAL